MAYPVKALRNVLDAFFGDDFEVFVVFVTTVVLSLVFTELDFDASFFGVEEAQLGEESLEEPESESLSGINQCEDVDCKGHIRV